MVAQVMAEFLRNQKKCLNSNDLDVSIGNFNKLPLLNIEINIVISSLIINNKLKSKAIESKLINKNK